MSTQPTPLGEPGHSNNDSGGNLKTLRATIASCAIVVLLAAGCTSAREYANDDAAGAAAGITFALRADRVAAPGLSKAQKLVKVRHWLTDPPSAYLSTTQDMKILATNSQHIDIVVYRYGRPAPMGGTERAWGRACVRYTISYGERPDYETLGTANQLKATEFDCPSALPLEPS